MGNEASLQSRGPSAEMMQVVSPPPGTHQRPGEIGRRVVREARSRCLSNNGHGGGFAGPNHWLTPVVTSSIDRKVSIRSHGRF